MIHARRGSTGFGKAYLHAGDKQWGTGTMQHDLTDAVRWAIAQGIADEAKVLIMGGSYGGYATLAGLTFTPELYCAGVDIVGPSHLKTLLETIPAYWCASRAVLVHTRACEKDQSAQWSVRGWASGWLTHAASCAGLLLHVCSRATGLSLPRSSRSEDTKQP